MTRFIVASSQACIGCRTCEVACALEHVAPGAEFHPRLKVMRLDELSVPVMCHQCENAPCVGACPFGAITIEVEAGLTPVIVKCDLCGTRERGPACVDVCPTAALSIMTEEQLSALQKQRNIATAVLLSL
ncbi:electron transport protein HydN [Klebsiella michiganensis]|uniref:electron transport protein HydN n=1 Tax=Klebsiella michiganensis TaxID=1134687 RepID=UPI00226D4A22|nr:electron transport protein HydN [Klebsiella michiganensis]ELT9745941.1 electron transport protein HydN [Klebsiella michiganensis]MCY0833809.1 electron transport protein HydN [Klebsiella michiganensis]MDD7828077.1 electron transport protein HydN [Klebsiella michiganensis]MDD7856747.1 electron transport protein HydN [Klebsiella michiganensis]HBM2991355.1 electron transport protein HydN [Klebsiella michiganensis]